MKMFFLRLAFVLLLFRGINAAPANNNFASATTIIGLSVTKVTTTAGATSEANEPDHDFQPATASVWYRWTPPENGFAGITTAGSGFDTILAVYRGTSLTSLIPVVSNDDSGGMTSKVSFGAAAGTVYYIAVDGYEGDSGYLRLTLNLVTGLQAPVNDSYANAILLTNAPISLIASNYLATLESGELTPVDNGGSSIWWLWEAPESGRYLISTARSDFDTILSVYNNQTLVTWDDDGARPASVVRFIARAGVRYHVSVQGYREAMGTVHLSIAADPPRPAPSWSLRDRNGRIRISSEFLGKVVILNVWATWCGPCLEEVPMFIAIQEKYGPDGLVIIGVSTDAEGFAVVGPFMDQYGVNYLVTLINADFSQKYGPLEFIPSTFIIDRKGMIVENFVGSYPQETFDSAILPLLYPEISLLASREGNEMVLRWPAFATGYVVQAATSLNPSNWSVLDLEISISGEFNTTRIPISSGIRFFQLVHN